MSYSAFEILATCNKVAANPDRESITALSNLIKNANEETIKFLRDYPLLALIKRITDLGELKNPNEIKFYLIDCLRVLLGRFCIEKTEALRTVCLILVQQIYCSETCAVRAELSEELKLATVECIRLAIKRRPIEIAEEFYSPINEGVLAQMCFTCLELIEKEKYNALRLKAVYCLMTITCVDDGSDFSDIVLRDTVARTIFKYLPKIFNTLSKVAEGNAIQSQQLTTAATQSLGRILCIILQDYEKRGEYKIPTTADFKRLFINGTPSEANSDISDREILGMKTKTATSVELRLKLNTVKRSPEWLAAACRMLTPLFAQFAKVRSSPVASVRFELATCCSNLIQLCRCNLETCFPIALETLIALSEDDNADTASVCCKTLTALFGSTHADRCVEVVKKLFTSQIIKLPRIINVADDGEQKATFCLLKGIIRFLSERQLCYFISNRENLKELVGILLYAVELEEPISFLIDEYVVNDALDQMNSVKKKSWINFKHIANESACIVEQVNSICQIITQSAASKIFVNYLIDLMCTGKRTAINETLLLVIFTIPFITDQQQLNAIEDELNENIHWNLAIRATAVSNGETKNDSSSDWFVDRTEGLYESAIEMRVTDMPLDEIEIGSDTETIHIQEAKFNVLHVCLLMEAVGQLGIQQKHEVDRFMLRFLHRVLEKTGSNNFILHDAGIHTLALLAHSDGHRGIGELLGKYNDFISHHIHMAIKSEHKSRENALEMFSVILRHSDLSQIPHLKSILESLLCRTTVTVSYFKVFQMFVESVAVWLTNRECDTEQLPEVIESKTTAKDLFEKWKLAALPIEEIEINADCDVDLEPENTTETDIETKAPLPPLIDLTVQIIKHTFKYMPSKSQSIRIVVLDILKAAIPIIADYENELLPIVHQLWYPFNERFKEKDPIVLIRCVELLQILANVSTNFIHQRTMTDVIPIFNEILREMEKISPTLKLYTQQYKLAEKIMSMYGALLINLDAGIRKLDEAMDTVLPYLNVRHSLQLQEAAARFFQELAAKNPYLVYSKLNFSHEQINQVDLLQTFKN